jgi:hypothetical protein
MGSGGVGGLVSGIGQGASGLYGLGKDLYSYLGSSSSFTPSGALGFDELMNFPTSSYTYTDALGNLQTGVNDQFFFDF